MLVFEKKPKEQNYGVLTSVVPLIVMTVKQIRNLICEFQKKFIFEKQNKYCAVPCLLEVALEEMLTCYIESLAFT